MASVNSGFTPVSSNFPLSAISLMVSSSPFYDESVNSMVAATNMVYREFLKSDEGQGFRGEVSPKKLYFYTSQRDTQSCFLFCVFCTSEWFCLLLAYTAFLVGVFPESHKHSFLDFPG